MYVHFLEIEVVKMLSRTTGYYNKECYLLIRERKRKGGREGRREGVKGESKGAREQERQEERKEGKK